MSGIVSPFKCSFLWWSAACCGCIITVTYLQPRVTLWLGFSSSLHGSISAPSSLDCQTGTPFGAVVWTIHRDSSVDKLLGTVAWINQGQVCPPLLCGVPDCSLASLACKHPTQHCGLLQLGVVCHSCCALKTSLRLAVTSPSIYFRHLKWKKYPQSMAKSTRWRERWKDGPSTVLMQPRHLRELPSCEVWVTNLPCPAWRGRRAVVGRCLPSCAHSCLQAALLPRAVTQPASGTHRRQ